MAEQFDVHKIAEAICTWGFEVVSNSDFQEELYDDRFFEYLNIFISTVYNFSNAFEVEFEEIFSKHCHKNMSEEQFLKFLQHRIKLLGELEGYFGYILPCVFVREIIYRYKTNFQCFNFANVVLKCVVEFIESKFKEFEFDNIWTGLLKYCIDINGKFNEIFDNDDSSSSSEGSSDDFMQEASLTEIADSKIIVGNRENELTSPDETRNDIDDKINSEDAGIKDASFCFSSGMSSDHGDFNDCSFNETKPNKTLDLSKCISEISLEAENEKCGTFEYPIIGDVESSDCDSDSSLSEATIDNELCEMYNILLPDFESRIEVFNVIEKCEDFLEKSESDVENGKVYQNCLLKSEVPKFENICIET